MSDWQRPEPAPELKRLEPLVGEWESIDEHSPSDWASKGDKGKTRNKFYRALDNYCYLVDVSGDAPFGKFKGHGIWFYDSKEAKYKIQWYDSFANHLHGTGDFLNDNELQFELKYHMLNSEIIERHTIKNVTKNSYDFIIETLIDGDFKLSSVSKYKRISF